jgi:protease-4
MSDTSSAANSTPAPVNITPDQIKIQMAEDLLRDLLKERRSEHLWKWVKRIFLSSISILLMMLFLGVQLTNMGFRIMPKKDVVGVINVTGEFGPGGNGVSASKVIPVLEKAFKADNVKAIFLNIESPGGSPAEAEKINAYIDVRRKETGKPVYAVIANVGASAAYMVAVHADEIYAGRYSLVGSIGAIMQGWDFHKAMDSVKITQRVYASGDLKGLMNPYLPMPNGGDEKAQSMVIAMGKEFQREVTARRGDKLNKASNLFTGEAWTGAQALELGLIDDIGTLDQVIHAKYPDLKKHDLGPNASSGGILGLESIGRGMVDAFLDRMGISAQMSYSPVTMKYQGGQ